MKLRTNYSVVGVCLGHPLVTAHKRSLGQGNVFTPVCHSVYRGGGSAKPHCRQTVGVGVGRTPQGRLPPGIRQQAGGTHPTGMHPCSTM